MFYSNCILRFGITVIVWLHVSNLSSGSIEYVPDFGLPSGSPNADEVKDIDPNCECGISEIPQSDSSQAAKNEFPWQVYIRVVHNSNYAVKPLRGRLWENGYHDCGGTIINDLFILTSSSCVLNFSPQRDGNPKFKDNFIKNIKTREIDLMNIFVFFNVINKNNEHTKSENSQVEKIFYHAQLPYPNRNSIESDYDIAILKLKSKLKFGFDTGKAPICLASEDQQDINWNEINKLVVGWNSPPGHINPSRVSGNKLDKTEVGVIYDNCFGVHRENMLYANYICTSKSLDYLDVGSPLIGFNTDGTAIQLGILSWIFPYLNESSNYVQIQRTLELSSPQGLFSKVNSEMILRFINTYSKQEGARWCKEPNDKELQPRSFANNYEQPWDDPDNQPPPHEELNCNCGQRRISTEQQIIRGTTAKPYEFPWLTYLLRTKGQGTSGCGSSIINDRTIMTAGHCVTYVYSETPLLVRKLLPLKSIQLYAHIYNRHEIKTVPGNYTRLTIQRIIVHPGYLVQEDIVDEAQYANYDIALLVLKDKIQITNPDFNPVCLPIETDVIDLYDGRKATLTGWGIENRGGQTPANFTKKIIVPIHSEENCLQYVRHSIRTDIFICADPLNAEGAGQGDSGGPLMIETSPNEFLQIGLVSHGTPPNETEKLDSYGLETITLYSRITAFVKWINYHAAGYNSTWCKRKTVPK